MDGSQTGKWVVEFPVSAEDMAAVELASSRIVDPFSVVVLVRLDDEEATPTIALDVEAEDVDTAIEQGRQLYARIREEARLTPISGPVDFVSVAVLGSDFTNWDRLLYAAEEMATQNRPELAVAAAQMYFEAYVGHLADWVAAGEGQPVTDAMAEGVKRRRSLTSDDAHRYSLALFGVDPPTLGSTWRAYSSHYGLRNRVVHRGQRTDVRNAQKSIEAVRAMGAALRSAAVDGITTS